MYKRVESGTGFREMRKMKNELIASRGAGEWKWRVGEISETCEEKVGE